MSTAFPKMPLSDTRSRKDLLFNAIQAANGEPITKPCPCSTLSEKDLLFNLITAIEEGGGGTAPTNDTPPSISGGVAEVATLDFTGLTADDHFAQAEGLPGLGFIASFINDPEVYGVWFQVDGLESQPDFSAQGVTQYQSIALAAGDTDAQCADALTGFMGVAAGAVVTFTQASPGAVPDAEDVDSDIVITTTVQGGFPVGTTFTRTEGVYTGTAPIVITGKWQHFDVTWLDVVPSDTDATYDAQAIYAGEMIRYYETATNTNGSTSVASNELGPIMALAFLTSGAGSTPRNDFDGTVGFTFDVTTEISVTHLGRWVISGNSQTHGVGLWDSSETLLASVNVNTSGAPVGYLYVALGSPVTLPVATGYRIGSFEFTSGDQWYDVFTPTTTGIGEVFKTAYRAGGFGIEFPFNDFGADGTCFGPVNFQYEPSGGGMEMANNFIPPADTIGPELFGESLPINWVGPTSNYQANTPITAGLSYRIVMTFSIDVVGGVWIFIREQTLGGADTGFGTAQHNVVQPAGTRVVFEFVANAATERLSLDILNLDGTSKTVQITEFSVQQIEEVTPYLNLSTDPTFNPATPTGAAYIDNPVVRQDDSIIYGRTVFGGEADLAYAFSGVPNTHLDGDYQTYDSAIVSGSTTAFGYANNDHIFSIIRPPLTDPVITGGDDIDDLLGNIHGQEAIRTPLSTHFQLWYDPLGDGNWIQRSATTNQQKMRCKRVKIVLNTVLTDMDALDRIESDHVFTLTAGGGLQCDRTDRFLEETTIDIYFYWMSTFNHALNFKGRRGFGTTALGSDVDATGGTGGTVENAGYDSRWAVWRRNSDNLCYGLACDLANEEAQPGATGLLTRVWYDPSNSNTKIYMQLEFDDPIPADTELTSRLWTFLYDPADTTEFHEEMAVLGAA